MKEMNESNQRDRRLLHLAAEVLRVYWGQAADPEQHTLRVRLPVLEADVELEVSVFRGVFSVASHLPVDLAGETVALDALNAGMPGAAYHYVLRPSDDGHQVWLQTKLLVPDVDVDQLRPPALNLAFQAGYRAGSHDRQATPPRTSGPSGYDHFVYLADFLAKAIHEQWMAQQEAASLALGDS
jgi:hypothetical protein